MKTTNSSPCSLNRLRLAQVFLLFLCCFSFSTYAQDDFAAWSKGMQDDFSEYKSKQDREFTDFLKMKWVGIKAEKGKPLYEKNKIIEPPKALPEKVKVQPETAVIVKVPVKKISPISKRAKPVLAPVKRNAINVEFFGNKLSFPYDKAMKKRISGKVGKNSISEQWSLLAKSDYEPLMKQLRVYQKQLKLNDWATALLVDRVAQKLYLNQKNEQTLFTWFVLIKSGFKSRLAYQNRDIYILLATQQKIYSAQSLEYKGTTYYLLGFGGGKQPKLAKVYTYDGDYPNSKQLFDMRISNVIVTGNSDVKRVLEFKFAQKKYKIDTTSNKYMVDFMMTYPQVHWSTYFDSNPNTLTRQQVLNQLRPHVNGLSEQEAVNFLLRFVQTSLTYATDDKQFGYEKLLFPEEVLFYPASDCEDRSFLFAWLVQELLGLDVVGIRYPGHIATAVKLNMKTRGDSVRFKGENYLIADPTYINANIGRAMPKFKNAKVEFIEISKI